MLDLSSKLLASQQQQPLFPPKSQVSNLANHFLKLKVFFQKIFPTFSFQVGCNNKFIKSISDQETEDDLPLQVRGIWHLRGPGIDFSF
jgi:hypothetical protein